MNNVLKFKEALRLPNLLFCESQKDSPTSPLQKANDESLTYLNQGQSYGLRLKRRPEQMKKLNFNTDMSVRVHLRVIFHDRRLQNTEQEQIMQWTKNRPCERFLEIDVPPSENINNVSQTAKGAIILSKMNHFFYSNKKDFCKKN